jgi:hypothetical protein
MSFSFGGIFSSSMVPLNFASVAVSYFGAACAIEKALHQTRLSEVKKTARNMRFVFMA